jgi:hypothetical protein
MKMKHFHIEDVKQILDILEIEKAFHNRFNEENVGNSFISSFFINKTKVHKKDEMGFESLA